MFPMIGEFCREMRVKPACILLRLISNQAANDMSKLAGGKENLKRLGTTHNCLNIKERKCIRNAYRRRSEKSMVSRLSGRCESGLSIKWTQAPAGTRLRSAGALRMLLCAAAHSLRFSITVHGFGAQPPTSIFVFVYTNALLAGTILLVKSKLFHHRRLYGCADFRNIVTLKY